jgi:excisionase family DNA binding protein
MPLAEATTFLTIPEAAKLARVSGRTLRRWLAAGRLQFHQASARSRVLIRPTDLERFLTRHETARPDLDREIEQVMSGLMERSWPTRTSAMRSDVL